jgi:predicted TIM-barrel fold metal-dependent hydrolase
MMDRLDEEVEKRGPDEAPYLNKLPSEYVASGRIFFGVECGEKTIPDGIRWGLEHTLLYSSDYPHWTATGRTQSGRFANARICPIPPRRT